MAGDAGGRLKLVPATLALCEAESLGRAEVGRVLGAIVPASWPPPVLEADDVERLRMQLASNPALGDWTLHYLLVKSSRANDLAALVGVAGYAGPPDANGAVEIGYAVAEEHQRQGYATEAVAALVARAFRDPAVTTIVATTYPELAPSIGVLLKTGFVHVSDDQATRIRRFERRRDSGDGA